MRERGKTAERALPVNSEEVSPVVTGNQCFPAIYLTLREKVKVRAIKDTAMYSLLFHANLIEGE